MTKVLKGREVQPESHKGNFGRLDERGREIPDGRPMEPPLGFKPTPDLMEQIRVMISNERNLRELEEPETFEEADNFNTGEEMGPEDYEPFFEPTDTAELLALARAGKPLTQELPQPAVQSDGGAGGVSPPVSDPAKPGGSGGPSTEPPKQTGSKSGVPPAP